MRLRVLTIGVALAMSAAGCTGGDGDDDAPKASAGPSASGSPVNDAARDLTEEVLGGEETPAPLASISGSLALLGASSAVTADILEVRAGADSTLLRWRLRSTTGERVRVYASTLSRPNRFDTRAVTLVDAAGNARLRAYTFVPQKSELDLGCICSKLPVDVGATGALMYALYPPLAANATSVDVVIAGLPPARGVRVTR